MILCAHIFLYIAYNGNTHGLIRYSTTSHKFQQRKCFSQFVLTDLTRTEPTRNVKRTVGQSKLSKTWITTVKNLHLVTLNLLRPGVWNLDKKNSELTQARNVKSRQGKCFIKFVSVRIFFAWQYQSDTFLLHLHRHCRTYVFKKQKQLAKSVACRSCLPVRKKNWIPSMKGIDKQLTNLKFNNNKHASLSNIHNLRTRQF